MLNRRTDLALEARELRGDAPGVVCEEGTLEGFPLTTVRIQDSRGAQALGKPAGTYYTLDLTGLTRREEDAFRRAVRAVAALLPPLLKLSDGESVLVAGLGNRAITPDAVGPRTADRTLVTRHLVDMAPRQFGSFRPVAALAAGVLGTTGVESGELVRAVADRIRPQAVIAVDALAARRLERLCATVQIADTGISPGSGVGNHRFSLSRETLGIPVIAVGVPTVVDGATLAADLLEPGGGEVPEALRDRPGASLIVTPKDIDQRVEDMAKVLGYGISLSLQSGLTLADLELLLE